MLWRRRHAQPDRSGLHWHLWTWRQRLALRGPSSQHGLIPSPRLTEPCNGWIRRRGKEPGHLSNVPAAATWKRPVAYQALVVSAAIDEAQDALQAAEGRAIAGRRFSEGIGVAVTGLYRPINGGLTRRASRTSLSGWGNV
jgi:hypothetical protein